MTEAVQQTDLFILSEAEHIHGLKHLTIQLHVIFTHHNRHVAVGQVAVVPNVALNQTFLCNPQHNLQ